ncbi:MAG: LuxR C-terminal-related transcriptional regulator [Pirellulales bacterium]
MAVRRTDLDSFSQRELQREFYSVTEPEENSSPEVILDSLPKRQREVLALLLRGLSLKEIAKRLGISPHTVNDYTKALYRRFQVSGRSELLALFIADPIASGI